MDNTTQQQNNQPLTHDQLSATLAHSTNLQEQMMPPAQQEAPQTQETVSPSEGKPIDESKAEKKPEEDKTDEIEAKMSEMEKRIMDGLKREVDGIRGEIKTALDEQTD